MYTRLGQFTRQSYAQSHLSTPSSSSYQSERYISGCWPLYRGSSFLHTVLCPPLGNRSDYLSSFVLVSIQNDSGISEWVNSFTETSTCRIIARAIHPSIALCHMLPGMNVKYALCFVCLFTLEPVLLVSSLFASIYLPQLQH